MTKFEIICNVVAILIVLAIAIAIDLCRQEERKALKRDPSGSATGDA